MSLRGSGGWTLIYDVEGGEGGQSVALLVHIVKLHPICMDDRVALFSKQTTPPTHRTHPTG